jgi:tripartite-type tricarboxylate transporter receptor subunit TctC
MTGTQRSPALPGIPTMAEQGYPQFDSGAWVGMVVPSGTPAPVIAVLNREIAKALKDPAVSAVFAEQAYVVVGSTPEQLGAFVRSEHQKWGKLIKEANLNIDP